MKRKLILLDLVLMALLAVMGIRARGVWTAARQREARMLRQKIKPEPAPPLPALPPHAPVAAAAYSEVAQKMLFARDRNPNVILDPVKPPPEPPMPALPVAYGAMFWGGDPSIILGDGKGQRNYHAGDTVGAFKLLAFDNQTITFEWNGKKVERQLDEIMAKPSDSKPGSVNTEAASNGAAPAKTASASNLSGNGANAPGADTGGGYKACAVGDTSPSGTVADGFKKIEVATPFGKSCHWEAVK